VCVTWLLLALPMSSNGGWLPGSKAKALYPKGESAVMEITPDALREIFEHAGTTKTTTVVEFYAPWCPHCQHYAPVYNRVAEHFTGTPGVVFGAFDCVRFKTVCSANKINGFPTVKAFHVPGEPRSFSSRGVTLKVRKFESWVEWVHDHLDLERRTPAHADGGSASAAQAPDTAVPRWPRSSSPGVFPPQRRLLDAATSLRFGLQYGVFVDGATLDASRLKALLDLLQDLSQMFPGSRVNRDSLGVLHDQVADGKGQLSSEQWDDLLGRWSFGKFSGDFAWSTMCNPRADEVDGSPHVTAGYTCGLWTLFHMLTFSGPRAGLSPGRTMATVRGYVDHFFGCSHCRQHFLQMFDECWGGRCDIGDDRSEESQRALALWLWRAHNTVNSRVAVESAELAASPDSPLVAPELQAWALWPSTELCPACRRTDSGGVVGQASPPAHGGEGESTQNAAPAVRWDEDAVFAFLQTTYDVGLWIGDPRDRTGPATAEGAESLGQGATGGVAFLQSSGGMTWVIFGLAVLGLVFCGTRRYNKRRAGVHKKVSTPKGRGGVGVAQS